MAFQNNYSGWSPEVGQYVTQVMNTHPMDYMGSLSNNDQRKAIEWANQQRMSDPSYWAQAFGLNSGGSSSTPFNYTYQDTSKAYRDKLDSLMSNPNSISNSGAYKFAFDQGQEAVNRQLAAKGLLNSGNRLYELTKFGQGLASQQYGAEMDRLSNLVNSARQADTARYAADTGRYSVEQSGQNQLRSMMMQAAMKQMDKYSAPASFQTQSGLLTRW